MRFAIGGPVVPVEWFFVEADALDLGFATPFYSRNWEDRSDRFDHLGEQPGPRPWRSGQRLHLLTGREKGSCPITSLMFGLAEGETESKEVTTAGVPVCCLPPQSPMSLSDYAGPPYSVAWVGAGGLTGTGKASWVRRKGYYGRGGRAFNGRAVWSSTVPPISWVSDGKAVEADSAATWVVF